MSCSPGMNGFDVLRGLRGKSTVPVIHADRARRGRPTGSSVWELGADDYLPKPFNPP